MSRQIGALLKAGMTFKLAQLRQATSDYVEDRTDHGKSVVAGYAVAAAMYAAAGIFLIATCLVGVAALFYWLEGQYGLFPALGICAGVLLALTLICALIASSRLRRKPPAYPSLSTRLGAALKGNPLRPAIKATKAKAVNAVSTVAGTASAATSRVSDKARHVSDERAAPRALNRARRTALEVLRSPSFARGRTSRLPRVGLVLGASLLGWAMVRRRRNEFAQTKS